MLPPRYNTYMDRVIALSQKDLNQAYPQRYCHTLDSGKSIFMEAVCMMLVCVDPHIEKSHLSAVNNEGNVYSYNLIQS